MDRKVLLFTTAGQPNSETETYINASFSSWKKWGFDVVLFGDEDMDPLCNKWGFTLDTSAEKNEFGLPLVRSLLNGYKKYPGYDFYMYLNSDIIFHNSPQNLINAVELDNFMYVGQRYDIFDLPKINYLTDDHNAITKLLDMVEGKLHNPGGIDYWGFTPNFWDVNDMPDFSIARGRFDHWLMGKALTEGKGPVIDLSHVWTPAHPEPKERTTGDYIQLYNEGNIKLAYQILRNTIQYQKAGLHGQTDMTPYYLDAVDGVITLQRRKEIPKNEFGKILKNDLSI